MKITKFGHCCLLIEEKGLRILTDPGSLSTAQDNVHQIDIILITHEHQDHIHIDSLKNVILNNRKARIITNKAVKSLLEKHGIAATVMEDKHSILENGVMIEAFGTKHAVIYPTFATVANVGFMIGNRLFYPGDAFTIPDSPVELLALPVAGPWMKMSEAVDYAKEIKPKICFPVHDGILKIPAMGHKIPAMVLEPLGIKLQVLEENKETVL